MLEDVEEQELEGIAVLFDCPRIFEGKWQECPAEGFNAVTITLDGRVHADLDWKEACEQARQAVEAGFAIFWDLQLGIFADLRSSFANQTQFLSLALSLEHFRDFIWPEFKAHTVGLSLFRGSGDFALYFPWDEHQMDQCKQWLAEIGYSALANLSFDQLLCDFEGQRLTRLFCRDVVVDYLTLLATRLPDTLAVYLFLDVSSLSDLSLQMELLNSERFDCLQLALKGQLLPHQGLGWHEPTAWGYSGSSFLPLPLKQSPTIGLCTPSSTCYDRNAYVLLAQVAAVLQERKLPFKLIAESHLTAQWDGLDFLLFASTALSAAGKRKLLGFCAAGGVAVAVGELVGVSGEERWEDWLKNQG